MIKKDRPNLNNLESPTVFKREGVKREFKKSVRGESAAAAIGKINPGCEIFGFTKGQFSCVDMVEHCLNQTGPASVFFATWSAATADIKAAHRFLESGLIRDLKFLVDFSFKSRKPEFCEELIATFGPDAIRVTVIHAKIVMIRNDDWDLVIRTSMNLNYNPRFENFEITDSFSFACFMQEIIDEIWSNQKAGEGFTNRPQDNTEQFRKSFLKQTGLFDGIKDGRDIF